MWALLWMRDHYKNTNYAQLSRITCVATCFNVEQYTKATSVACICASVERYCRVRVVAGVEWNWVAEPWRWALVELVVASCTSAPSCHQRGGGGGGGERISRNSYASLACLSTVWVSEDRRPPVHQFIQLTARVSEWVAFNDTQQVTSGTNTLRQVT